MTNLGLTLAWLVVQVAILLAPALVLNSLASRRGPAAGAWVAVLSLGLVVALNVAAFVPQIGWNDRVPPPKIALPSIAFENKGSTATAPRSLGADVVQPAVRRSRALDWLRPAWDRIGRGVAEPAIRVRPWASTFAAVALAATAAGLLRLVIGFWAVALCCRRGRQVDEPGMTGLLEELGCAMECRQPVALREVPNLTTPATAGRRRPMLLLPDDWRSWSGAECRAVLAHELAHIVRGDYTTGLLAQLAVALNCYHPLVRFMAGRLWLQHEQAADAMAARFAGGRARYLVALSSLALRQDGCSPNWPARAFLPARGTLIRRIAMLREESNSKLIDRPYSGVRRMLTIFGLIGLTIGVATLRGPARGADDDRSSAVKTEAVAPQPRDSSSSVVVPYVREGWDGFAVIRPAAAFRHKGMDRFIALMEGQLAEEVGLSEIAKQLKVDISRPGFLKLRSQNIEWVTAGISFGQGRRDFQADQRHTQNSEAHEPMHAVRFGTLAVRMITPFDWLAFLRQWRFEFEEARANGRSYYQFKGQLKTLLGPNPCAFLPDDRTIVLDEEDVIRTIAAGGNPAPPAYVRSTEWERASRGLVAIVINNHKDTFAKHYDLGRPDDTLFLSVFKGLDTWILGVEDADPIVLQAHGACRDRNASESVTRSLDSLIKIGRQSIEHNVPESPDAGLDAQAAHMMKALATNVRVEHTPNALTVRAQNFGSLANLAAIVVGESQEANARVVAGKEAKKF